MNLVNRLQLVYLFQWWMDKASRALYELGYASVMEAEAQGKQQADEISSGLMECFQRGRMEALNALNKNG